MLNRSAYDLAIRWMSFQNHRNSINWRTFVQWLCILQLSRSIVPIMRPSTAEAIRNHTALNVDCTLDEGKFQYFSYSLIPEMNLPYKGEYYRDDWTNAISCWSLWGVEAAYRGWSNHSIENNHNRWNLNPLFWSFIKTAE